MKNKMSKSRAWTIITLLFCLPTIVMLMGSATQINLANQIFGLLPVANGGTNLSSGTSGGILGYTATGTLASSAALPVNDLVIGGGASALPTGKSWADADVAQYAPGGGTAQVQTVTLSPAATALVNGLEVTFLPIAANTAAAPTLAVNGLTAKPITKYGATALAANDLTTTAIAYVIYDGTEWQLLNPQTTPAAAAQNQGAPTGTINGSNTAFTLSPTPSASSNVNCFLNGVQQQQGAGNDYTISGAAITYLTAPPTGSKLNCTWF